MSQLGKSCAGEDEGCWLQKTLLFCVVSNRVVYLESREKQYMLARNTGSESKEPTRKPNRRGRKSKYRNQKAVLQSRIPKCKSTPLLKVENQIAEARVLSSKGKADHKALLKPENQAANSTSRKTLFHLVEYQQPVT